MKNYDFTTGYEGRYDRIEIPKKNKKGTRVIYDYKSKRMKRKHKWVMKQIGGNKEFLAFDGLDIVESAKIHKDSQSFIKLDFTAFFDSVNAEDVMIALKSNKRFSEKHFAKWVDQVTDKDGFLLQGTCLSPYFANMVLGSLDKHMQERGKDEGFIYTRYADDIMISFPDRKDKDILWEMGMEFAKYVQNYTDKHYPSSRVRINPSKTEVITFATENHCKVLSWNIIRGKDGMDNYITAGRNRRRTGYNKGKKYTAYHSYQTHTFKMEEDIRANKRRKPVTELPTEVISNENSEINPFMFV